MYFPGFEELHFRVAFPAIDRFTRNWCDKHTESLACPSSANITLAWSARRIAEVVAASQARRGDRAGLKHGIDVVFVLQAVGDDVELQRTDRAEDQFVAVDRAGTAASRPPPPVAAGPLQLLEFSGLRKMARWKNSGAKDRMPVKRRLSLSVKVSPSRMVPWLGCR